MMSSKPFTIITVDPDQKNKEHLQKSIANKKNKLKKLTKKVEILQTELQKIQDAYELRIGRLYAKDNDLDIQIITYKNIVRLMQEGKTLSEAKKELDSFFLGNNFEKHEEQAFADFMHEAQPETKNEQNELKTLWKKLILQFHPDLVTDPEEKSKREKIMKKINKAYNNQNIKDLRLLESNLFLEEPQDESVSKLEYTLVELENLIIGLEIQYKSLIHSEWFYWKKRLKTATSDIFADLERNLLDDIVSKTKLLKDLKSQTGEFE